MGKMEKIEKIVLTGASGFVGSSLLDMLLSKGYFVFVITRKESSIKHLPKSPMLSIHLVDWENPHNIKDIVEKANYIIHCAGVTSAKDFDGYYKGNVIPTIALLKASKKANLSRFILISSQAAAGPSISPEKLRTETDQAKPISNYGLTKKQAEDEALKYKGQFPITILRPSAIYGPRDKEFYPLFKLTKNRLSLLIGSGKKQVNLIYIKDFADALLKVIENKPKKGSLDSFSTYFLTDGNVYDWKTIYKTAKEVCKVITIPIYLPNFVPKIIGYINDKRKTPTLLNSEKVREMLVDFWLCSSAKIEQELNFKACYSLSEGFAKTYEWYRKEKLL